MYFCQSPPPPSSIREDTIRSNANFYIQLDKIINPDEGIAVYDVYLDCYKEDVSEFRSQLDLSDKGRKDPAVISLRIVNIQFSHTSTINPQILIKDIPAITNIHRWIISTGLILLMLSISIKPSMMEAESSKIASKYFERSRIYSLIKAAILARLIRCSTPI